MVNPGRPISADTMAVHHILDAHVADAPFWKEIAASILKPAGRIDALAAHRAAFEQRYCTPRFTGGMPWICTWKSALRVWRELPRFSNQLLRYQRMPEGLIHEIGLPAHRAMPDAYVTAHHLRDLLNAASLVRRHLLEDFLDSAAGAIQLSEEVYGDGIALLAHACSLGLEGIIVTHRDQPYRSGRTGDWLKIKGIQSESFMIVGYEQSTSARGGIGSLLLAARKGHDWVYVGSVGTGFNTKDAEYLRSTLDKLRTKRPAVPLKGKNLVFAEPTLIAEIEFRGWTHDGSLRHASYKGLREVQDNAVVFDINEKPAA